MNENYSRSFAATSTFEPPAPPGLEFRPFQRAGIEYSLYRQNTLIADEMGLGKTIQAIGFCNVVRPQSILILCPASLKLNWVREWNKWTTTGIQATLTRSACWVLNYDVLQKNHANIKNVLWDVLIIDEAHYLKNPKANRTREVFGGYSFTKVVKGCKSRLPRVRPIKARRVLALTGTPIENKPIEFFPLLNYLDPQTFDDGVKFGIRYCAGRRSFDGWDFTGASNLVELQEKVRSTVMIRRLKAQVLKELPAKIRQVIEVDKGGFSKLFEKLGLKSGSDLMSDQEYGQAVKMLDESQAKNPAFNRMSEARKELAETKLPFIIQHLRYLLETNPKVVVFVHHRDLALGIAEVFGPAAVSVLGGMSPTQKDAAVTGFQNDPRIRLFIGNFQAAGVGLTLTAASLVVMAETPWKPGEMKQAEDRAHRIGQTGSVLVQHLVLAKSWEARIAKTLVRKMEIIDQATDDETMALISDLL